MLFARDDSQIHFDFDGFRMRARMVAMMVLVSFVHGQHPNPRKLDEPGWSFRDRAKKWFIDHQREFNLEGYQ